MSLLCFFFGLFLSVFFFYSYRLTFFALFDFTMFSLIPDKHKMYMNRRKSEEKLIEFRGWKTIVRIYFILAPLF